MNALLLIDIQNDFLPGGALPVPRGDMVVPVANRLIPDFNLVVATLDWHPKNHGSFATQHPGRKPGELIDLNGLPQILWPDHCVQHTVGAQFAPGLNVAGIHRVIRKGQDPAIDSYSAFFDNGQRKATGLAAFLKEQGVTTLYVMGLATDYCVLFTVLDASRLGFEVNLIADGVRGVDLTPGDCQRAIQKMKQAGTHVVNAEEIFAIH